MSHLNPGLLSTYNSLTDKHLAGYFNNTRIRRHLQRVGLITRSGRIVPDKEYRHKLIRRDHQRHLRECLAQAIFHKVLDMERHHQIDIKRKLEDFARRERVHKIKVERSKRYDEDIIPLLSPRPPTGPRNGHKQHSGPEGEHSEFSESPGSSRPNTAPGKMQRPHRLQPIHSNCTTASARRTSPGYRHKDSSDDTEQQFSCTLDKDTRALTMTEFSTGISPYQLPVINNYITPVPPSTKRNLKGTPNGMMRGRRLRPTTAPGAPVKAKDSKFHKTSVHSNVSVIMVFYGKTVHLSHDDIDMRDEVKVFQQHCGGENLCVYKGRLMGGEAFQFVSRRHRGFPFSLTFFLNGLQVDRLSSCCEFKHRKGSRLGGKHGHFGFSSVEGASPCYKCIISMGLDKKPTPPPKRTKEDMGRGSFTTNSQEMAEETKEVEEEDIKQDSQSYTESGPIKVQAEDDLMTVEAKDVEEDKAKDDYEEDFEADNERADEDTEEAKLQDVNPTSSIVRGDSKINNKDGEIINHEMEDEEKGRNSNEFEQNDKAEEKKSPSCSSRSTSSSSSREDSESEAEEVKEAVKTEEAVAEDEIGQIPEEQLQIEGIETTSVPTAENDQRGLEDQMEAVDDGNLETSSQTPPQTTAVEGDTETRQSHGDSTEKLELLDTNMHPEEGKEVETIGAALDSGDNAAKPEGCSGDTEPERGSLWKGTPDSSQKGGAALSTPPSTSPSVTPVKSVQEKLIEAIMKEAHCSSEPELSDTSTEEEEELSSEIKTMVQNNNGVGEDKTDISSMQKPASTEGGNFESAVMPVEETSIEQPAEDQGICTEIEKEFEVGDTPVSVQEPPTEAGNSTDRKRKETGGEDSEPQTNRASSKTQLEAGEKTDAGENLTEMTEAMVGEPVNRKEQIYIESQKIMKVMKNTEASEAQAQESVDGALVKKGGNPEETNSETNETIAEETGTEVEETIGEVKTKSSDVATKEFTTGMADTKNQDAADYTENHVKGKKEETEAQTEEIEAQTEVTEAQVEAPEAQEEETEAQAEASKRQVEASEAQEEKTKTQTEESKTQTEEIEAQAEETEAQVEESEAQADETEAQVEVAEAEAENTEAQVEKTEAQSEEIKAQEEETKTQAEEIEAQAEETEAKVEAQAEETEAQADASEAHAEETNTRTEEIEVQAEASKTQEEENEAQVEASEAQAEETEAQVEEPEAQAEVIEAQAEASKTHEEDTEAQAEETEAQKESSEAQAEENEAQVEASEAQAEETEAQVEEPEAQAEVTEVQAEASEAQVEEPEAQAKVTEAQAEETEAQAEASGAQAEASETQAEETGSHVKASKTQKEETEAQAKASEAQAEENEAQVEASEAQAEETEAQVEEPEAQAKVTEAQAEASGAQAEASETQAEETGSHVKASKTQKEETEAQAEASEAQAEKTEAQAEETETQVEASITQEEENEAQPEASITQEEDTEAQAEETEAQKESSEAQAEETEAQVEASEAQAEETEAQIEEPEAQAEASEAQVEEPEAQAKVTEAQAEETEAQAEASEAQAEASETQAEETGSQVKASKTQEEETEAQAEAAGAQAEKTEAQAEETGTQVEASITQEEENEAQAEASITQEEDTEAQAEASEAQAEETEAQVEVTEAQVKASEAQVEEPKAQAEVTEAQTEASEAQAEETEAQAEAAGAQAEKTEAQAEETETQVEASITQEEENETQAVNFDAQAEDTSTEIDSTAVGSECTVAYVTKDDAERKDNRKETLKTQESGSEKLENGLKERTLSINVEIKAIENKDKEDEKKHGEAEKKEVHGDLTEIEKDDVESTRKKTDANEDNGVVNNEVEKFEMERKQEVTEGKNDVTDSKYETEAKSQDIQLKDRQKEAECGSKNGIKRKDTETTSQETEEIFEENEATEKYVEDDLRDKGTEAKSEEKDKEEEIEAPAGNKDSKAQEGENKDKVQLNTEQEARCDKTVVVKGDNGTIENVMTVDKEDEFIVSIEDKQDNEVVEVGETDAKGEEMEANRQTAVITAEGQSKVEDAIQEPMAELEEGERGPISFETGSKVDGYDDRVADVDSKAEEAVTGFEEVRAMAEEEKSKSNPPDLQSDIKAGVDSESKVRTEDIKDDEEETYVKTEVPFGSTKEEITETSDASEDKVVDIFAEGRDTILGNVVQEDEHGIDGIKQKPAAEEIKNHDVGEIARTSAGMKSEEQQSAEKIMDLENEGDLPFRKASNDEEEMNTEPEEYVVHPEGMGKVDEGDLVTNWINKHQALRCFQTFVEPLDDLNSFSLYERGQLSVEVSESTTAHTELPAFECSEKILDTTENNTATDTAALVQDVKSEEKVYTYTGNIEEDLLKKTESVTQLEIIENEGDQSKPVLEQQHIKEVCTRSNVSECGVPRGSEPRKEMSAEMQEEDTTVEEMMGLQSITKSYKCRDDDTENYVARTEDSDRVVRELGVANKESEGEEKDEVKTIEEMPGLTPIAKSEGKNSEGSESSASYCTTEDSGRNSGEAVPTKGMSLVNEENGTTGEEIAHFTFITETKDKNRKDAESLVPCSLEDVTYLTSVTGHGEKNGEDTGSPLHDSKSEEISRYLKESEAVNKESSMTEEQLCRTDELPARTTTPKTEEKKRDDKNVAPSHSKPEESDINSIESGDSKQKAEIDEGQNTVIKEIPNLTNSTEYKSKGVIEESGKLTVTREILGMQPFSVENPGLSTPTERRE